MGLGAGALAAIADPAGLAREYEAPQGALECAIAHVWQELLGLQRVGRHDHFFELGGHSLLAARFADDYERETGIRLVGPNSIGTVSTDPAVALTANAAFAVDKLRAGNWPT